MGKLSEALEQDSEAFLSFLATSNVSKPLESYKPSDSRLRHNYGSHAAYCVLKADEDGNIDMATAKPLRGTYFGSLGSLSDSSEDVRKTFCNSENG